MMILMMVVTIHGDGDNGSYGVGDANVDDGGYGIGENDAFGDDHDGAQLHRSRERFLANGN